MTSSLDLSRSGATRNLEDLPLEVPKSPSPQVSESLLKRKNIVVTQQVENKRDLEYERI
jgi:hypothetical protein